MKRFASLLALFTLSVVPMLAAEPTTAATPPAPAYGLGAILGGLGSLTLGLIQLVVGLMVIAFAIRTGLVVVSKLLGGLDIWAEIKKRNLAVAILAAGVVLSYTNVLGTGIDSMSKPLAGLAEGAWQAGITGLLAGVINLLIAIAVASFSIAVTFRILDKLTKDINEKDELLAGNMAIGILYAGALFGVSQVVSSAISGVSLSVQAFLSIFLRPFIGV